MGGPRGRWLQGADTLFEELMHSTPWESTTQELYGKVMVTPRLVARWTSPADIEGLPPVIEQMRALLVTRYRRPFIRWAQTSTAMAATRSPGTATTSRAASSIRSLPQYRSGPLVVSSCVHAREGPSSPLALGMGDLVVMGGSSQRTWLHAVPKVASAGPRISVAYRHSSRLTSRRRARLHGEVRRASVEPIPPQKDQMEEQRWFSERTPR